MNTVQVATLSAGNAQRFIVLDPATAAPSPPLLNSWYQSADVGSQALVRVSAASHTWNDSKLQLQ